MTRLAQASVNDADVAGRRRSADPRARAALRQRVWIRVRRVIQRPGVGGGALVELPACPGGIPGALVSRPIRHTCRARGWAGRKGTDTDADGAIEAGLLGVVLPVFNHPIGHVLAAGFVRRERRWATIDAIVPEVAGHERRRRPWGRAEEPAELIETGPTRIA